MKSDLVDRPAHYNTRSTETIDYIREGQTPEEFRGYCEGNIIKYFSRFKHKGEPLQDLKKAAWYLNKLIGTYE